MQRPWCRWLQGDAMDLPFADASFDSATMGYGLRNVSDIPAALRELNRVLKPGAILPWAACSLSNRGSATKCWARTLGDERQMCLPDEACGLQAVRPPSWTSTTARTQSLMELRSSSLISSWCPLHGSLGWLLNTNTCGRPSRPSHKVCLAAAGSL